MGGTHGVQPRRATGDARAVLDGVADQDAVVVRAPYGGSMGSSGTSPIRVRRRRRLLLRRQRAAQAGEGQQREDALRKNAEPRECSRSREERGGPFAPVPPGRATRTGATVDLAHRRFSRRSTFGGRVAASPPCQCRGCTSTRPACESRRDRCVCPVTRVTGRRVEPRVRLRHRVESVLQRFQRTHTALAAAPCRRPYRSRRSRCRAYVRGRPGCRARRRPSRSSRRLPSTPRAAGSARRRPRSREFRPRRRGQPAPLRAAPPASRVAGWPVAVPRPGR